MFFHIWMANHNTIGQRSLEDVIGIIGHQLMALGHKAHWDPENKNFVTREIGYNIIIEGFTDAVVDIVRDAHEHGARFICIATEEPTEKGFNHGTSQEMIERQYNFVKAAPYLDAILHLVPGQGITDWYAQHAPSAYVELGYAPTLMRQETQREPPFDFGFYGSVSKRRMVLLKKLAKASGKRNAVRVIADFATQVDRDRAMQEAKVLVQIRKFDEMGLVSSSRCNTALCLRRPVVAEPHELAKPWDEVVKFARTDDDFIQIALISRGMWRNIHYDQFTKFKEKFTPEVCLGDPLRRVGITHQPARAA